jgi:hypothetical protein
VRWFRRFLGEDTERPIRHPLVISAFGARTLGTGIGDDAGETAATLIPSVGCPMGCNFCSTSHMFGGKGRFVNFYETGDELFELMQGFESCLGTQSFFVMDENFLFHRSRALQLLERMREAGKSWSLYLFSSANTLRLYSMEELVGLGVSWVWLGIEGQQSGYVKLRGADTRALVRELQSHGIRVLGSTIVGLPEHDAQNIDAAIAYAVDHDTEFHQFMLYTPVPGTPLWSEQAALGTLLSEEECPLPDAHGQLRFSFRHPRIRGGEETEFLRRAFRVDFERNGPSLVRIARTMLQGWQRHQHHPEPRVRHRFERECRGLATSWAGVVWAAERWLRSSHPELAGRIRALGRELAAEFGWRARVAAPVVGRLLLASMALEQRRLRRGRTWEPSTFYETNRPAEAAANGAGPRLCRFVEAPVRAEVPEAQAV